jgi:outer membrane protein
MRNSIAGKYLILCLASFVFCLFAGVASAADTIKIGYVDIQKLIDQSDEAKKARTTLETLKASKEKDLEKMVTTAKKMEEELKKQQNILSDDAKKAKIDELEKMDRDIRRFVSDSEAELSKKQREMDNSLLTELVGIIQKLGQEGEYSLILPATVILYSSKGTDITDMVLKRYNELKAKASK